MFGLSFLVPGFLAAAAAAAVPIVLHLLRRHPDVRVRFAPVRMLRQAPLEQARHRRLREWLLLALRVAALLLLALAFARPYVPDASASSAAPVTIVAVDTSFSLSAPGQFARARQLARQAVRRAAGGQPVGLERFADRADLVVAPTMDRPQVLAAIDRLRPGAGATRYQNALARAAGAIGARRGTVVLVTDLQASGWDAGERGALPGRVAIELADVGAPKGNLAVVDLRRQEGGVVATVRNEGSGAATGQARLTVDGRPGGVQPFSVPPGGAVQVPFAAALPETGAAAVSIDDPTGYVADNTRFLALDPPAPMPVLAVTASGGGSADAFYLAQALQAGGAAEARFSFHAVRPSAVGTLPAGEWARDRAVVLLTTQGLDSNGREALAAFVRRGGGLFVAVGPGIDADVLRSLLAGRLLDVTLPSADGPPLSLVPADARHPIVAALGAAAANLGVARFRRVAQVTVPAGADVVAQFSNGAPALVEYPRAGGRVLLFASDLGDRWNDFPLHPMFLPFLYEALGYLSGPRQALAGYFVGDVPPGVPAAPGVVSLPAGRGSGAVRRVAVNVDPRESDPARLTASEFRAAIVRLKEAGTAEAQAAAVSDEARQNLWWYALVLVLTVLAIESVVARRAV